LARLSVPAAVPGTKLEVRGAGGSTPAEAATLPFYDPGKARRIAMG
jgi:glycine cleavage system aminomethyltransferase T